MSRSLKQPVFTDQQRNKKSKGRASRSVQAKRDANRAVRRANKKACEERDDSTLASGKQYRKESCSWSIRDWAFHDPKNPKAYRK